MAKAKTELFCLKEDGIHIETNGLRFRVGYEQAWLPFDAAKKWCAEQGGDIFSFEQGIVTAALSSEINKALKRDGNPLLEVWYWLNRENPARPGYVYNFSMGSGYVNIDHENFNYFVRAVFALE